jgi:hypothetical protein
MASMLTTRIALTNAQGGEKLVSDFDFSPGTKLTAQTLFAYGRSRFQQKNIFLASPDEFFVEAHPIDWKYVGGDKVLLEGEESDQENAKKKQLLVHIESTGEGLCDGDRVVVLPADDGTCNLFRATRVSVATGNDSTFHCLNAFHANAGVDLVALPDIETVHLRANGKENRFHLSTLSSEFLTIGDLKKSVPCDSGHKLLFRSPSGKTWHQENPRDDNLLIQELGLSGPVVNVISLQPFEVYVEMMGNAISIFKVYITTTVYHVKVMIQKEAGIPCDQQTLVFDSKHLDDDRTMCGYSITGEARLYLVMRLHDGMHHETMAREAFAPLAGMDSTEISVTLLLPGGAETKVRISPWMLVTNLKALATSTLTRKSSAKKREMQSGSD